jgi:DNA-binding response OmpR family regulator
MVIVMITASDKKREADRSIAAGADILIGKPFSPKQFWNQVDSLIKDRRVQ